MHPSYLRSLLLKGLNILVVCSLVFSSTASTVSAKLYEGAISAYDEEKAQDIGSIPPTVIQEPDGDEPPEGRKLYFPLVLMDRGPIPDLSIEIEHDGDFTYPTGIITYTLKYQNIGKGIARDVFLLEQIPEDMLLDEQDACNQDWEQVNDTVYKYSLGNVAGKSNGEVSFCVEVPADIAETVNEVVNRAEIRYNEAFSKDINPDNNRAEDVIPLYFPPDLSIQITADVAQAEPGGGIIFTLSYGNQSSFPANKAFLQESLPLGTAFDEVNSTAGWIHEGGGIYTFALGDLEPGEQGQVSFAIQLDATFPAGQEVISNQGLIGYNEVYGPDLHPEDNQVELNVAVNAVPDLRLTMTDGDITAIPGGQVVYTIEVANDGNQDASGLVLIDLIPESTEFLSSVSTAGWQLNETEEKYTYSIGLLVAGDTQVITFAVKVDELLPAGLDEITNSISVSDDGTGGKDPNPGNNISSEATPVEAAPDLVLNKTADVNTVQPGGGIIYELVLTNNGTQGASGVAIVENLPLDTMFDNVNSAEGWQQVETPSTYSYSVGELAAGDSITVQFAVTVVAAPEPIRTSIDNTAISSDDESNGTDLNLDDNTVQLSVPLVASPDLSITKTTSSLVKEGEMIRYDLTYTNEGHSQATGVIITETVPQYTTFNTDESDPAWQQVGASNEYTYFADVLEVGETRQVVFAVTADAAIPDEVTQITNTLGIADDGNHGPDLDQENNSFVLNSSITDGVTNVCGNITEDTTWTAGQSPYVLTCDVTIDSGVTLTVEPGTIIKPNAARGLIVKGTLNMIGTEAIPIYMTSYKDDSIGGDSNGDGDATSPSPGDWNTIYVTGSSATITHTTIRYGGTSGTGNDLSSLRVANGASVVFNNSEVGYSSNSGIYLDESNVSLSMTNSVIDHNNNGVYSKSSSSYSCDVTISGSTISNNTNGLQLYSVDSGSIHFSNIIGNQNFGVNVNPRRVMDSRYNYWGSNDGPSPFGSGDTINTYQQYDPVCQCNVTLPAVFYNPWLDTAGNVVGLQPVEAYGVPSNTATAWASDPVNVVFGNYSYQYTDLAFPTLGEKFAFRRSYNSAFNNNSPLGVGWTHNYQITAIQSGSDTITVQREDGRKDLYIVAGNGAYTAPPGVFDRLLWVTDHFELTLKDQTVYTFNPNGTLASITDPNGNATSFVYTSGLLTSITEPTDRQVHFTYTEGMLTQITDQLGRSVNFGYTGDRLTSVTDVNGKTTIYAYDPDGRLESITDANNHTFVHNVYDTEGRIIEQRDALNNLTTFDYDPSYLRTTVTDPREFTTVYHYDSAFRVTRVTDALGNSETYTYDMYNNRKSVTDKRDNTTYYTYDDRGNLLTVTDPHDGVTTYTYDSFNNLLTQTDANNHTTTYTYDANHNLETETDANTKVTSYTYYTDAARNGLLATVTDPLLSVTNFDYDTYGNLDTITDALSHTTSRTYDAGGRMLSETDPLTHTSIYTYDNANRVLTMTDPATGQTTNTYDNVGNLLTTTDPNNHTTTYTYTAKDQIETIADAAGYVTTYVYDEVGNRISVTDGNNHKTTYVYDGANHMINITDPLNRPTVFGYDENGNRTSVTDALSHTTTYTYDELNRKTEVTDALNHKTITTYDAVGNILTVTDANNHTTTYTYDVLDRLTTVKDALDGEVTYTYDANGNRLSMTDANNHTTTYTYDDLNRLLTETDPLNHTWTFTYDAAGRKIQREDANGVATIYTYDDADRLTDISAPFISITYGYDLAGNRISMIDETGTTTYIYDEIYRPTTLSQPNGTITYTYDAVNRLSVTLPGSLTTNYVYDDADQLVSVTDWNSQTTIYEYDDAGRLTTTNFPNGVVSTNAYNDADRLTNISTEKNTTTILDITYTLDNVGNRLTMVEPTGTTAYTYDELNRLTTVSYPTGSPSNVSYTYDPMGNRLTMEEDSITTTYTYDDADRLTSTSGGSSLSFTWDDNGQMLTKGSRTFTWDAMARMIALNNGSTTASYSYNGDGVRVERTVNSASITNLQDLAAGLPTVLSETSAADTRHYVYGAELITSIDSAATSYYHTDGLGSTRVLSDTTGTATDEYAYDVFGRMRAHAGSSNNAFTYIGEQLDPEAGLVFLRARYYDPGIGRFLAVDPIPSTINSTQGQNCYVYCLNNPIICRDHTGKAPSFSDVLDLGSGIADIFASTTNFFISDLQDPLPPISISVKSAELLATFYGYTGTATSLGFVGSGISAYKATQDLNEINREPTVEEFQKLAAQNGTNIAIEQEMWRINSMSSRIGKSMIATTKAFPLVGTPLEILLLPDQLVNRGRNWTNAMPDLPVVEPGRPVDWSWLRAEWHYKQGSIRDVHGWSNPPSQVK